MKIRPGRQINEMPGVYFTQIKHFVPLTMDSPFVVTYDDNPYGKIGAVYPVSKIASQYRINFRGDRRKGYGLEISPRDFFLNEKYQGIPKEAIARTNQVVLSDASYITVEFSHSETMYITDQLFVGGQVPTFAEVLNLYQQSRNDHWYIRKSALLKVVDLYAADGKPLPPIVALSPVNGPCKIEKSTFGTEFDTDSDHELLV